MDVKLPLSILPNKSVDNPKMNIMHIHMGYEILRGEFDNIKFLITDMGKGLMVSIGKVDFKINATDIARAIYNQFIENHGIDALRDDTQK